MHHDGVNTASARPDQRKETALSAPQLPKMKKRMSLKQRIESHPAVQEVFAEDGTWWVWLHTNWINPEMECSQIHERTLTECASVLKGVRLKTEIEKARTS